MLFLVKPKIINTYPMSINFKSQRFISNSNNKSKILLVMIIQKVCLRQKRLGSSLDHVTLIYSDLGQLEII